MRHQFLQTCTISRNATAGSSGAPSVIESSLSCTPVYPAGRPWWSMAVEFYPYEIYTAFVESLRANDILTIDGKLYFVREVSSWKSNLVRRAGGQYLRLLLEARA